MEEEQVRVSMFPPNLLFLQHVSFAEDFHGIDMTGVFLLHQAHLDTCQQFSLKKQQQMKLLIISTDCLISACVFRCYRVNKCSDSSGYLCSINI